MKKLILKKGKNVGQENYYLILRLATEYLNSSIAFQHLQGREKEDAIYFETRYAKKSTLRFWAEKQFAKTN